MRSTFFVIAFFFVSLLFSSLLMMIAKKVGDNLIKTGTEQEGLPLHQNWSDTFCKGLKLQKTFHNIYYKTNIYRCKTLQTPQEAEKKPFYRSEST